LIVSGAAGAFFLRRQGRLREKQTWGRAARLVFLGTDRDRQGPGRGAGEGTGAGYSMSVGAQRLAPTAIREKWPH